MSFLHKPQKNEYAASFSSYVERVPPGDVFAVLTTQKQSFTDFIRNIPLSKAGYRYAENKWSVAEVVGHVIDSERIMGYRALAVSRNEKANIPGFDEKEYVAHANFDERDLHDLAKEFALVRASNVKLLENFSPEMFGRTGICNGENCSVRALVYIIAGHLAHHEAILKERYGC